MINTNKAANSEQSIADDSVDRPGTALITGASRGIGRAVSLQLAKEQFNVALVGCEAQQLEDVAEECRALGVEACCYIGSSWNRVGADDC